MKVSDIYAGLGADAPAVFTLQREHADPEVVAHLVFEGEPQSKARARATRNGHVYTPRTTREALTLIAARFRQQNPTHVPNADESYGVIAIFFCATWQRRDVDNMLKLILDGLNKVAWDDDSQVSEVSGRISRGHDKGHARTEVVVYRTLAHNKPTRACLECGKPFRDYPSQRAQGRKFCGAECGYAFRRRPKVRTCEHCAGEFEAHGPKTQARFCSTDCRSAAARVTMTCKECQGQFTLPTSIANRSKHPACSPECRAAIARRNRGDAAKGTCCDCGGPTSKRSYTRCKPCQLLASRPVKTHERPVVEVTT